jgi:uncharacterized protein (DUF4213/DUF364 family)
LLKVVRDGQIVEVRIGVHWTAVVAEVGGELRCGLAATTDSSHLHTGQPEVPMAGQVESMTGKELAQLAASPEPSLASMGVAAINALLPREAGTRLEGNAEQYLETAGEGKHVAMVGHFPFAERLRPKVGKLTVLEQRPLPSDLPAEAAPEILPTADVVAITGMALVNGTLEGLLRSCRPDSLTMILGPSTPISAVLFDFGVDLLSGSEVVEIDRVLKVISQRGNFHQVHKAGVRLVTMAKGEIPGVGVGGLQASS